MSKVTILQTGYAFLNDKNQYEVSATSTLIQNKSLNIIVDPGGAWEKEHIIQKLKENNVTTESIDIVIGTHGHSDHVGNLNLFPNAKHIVGHDINIKSIYETLDLSEPHTIIPNEIVIMATPGHTKKCISLIVYNEINYGTVAVCGDLFECENDEDCWECISEDVETHKINRKKISDLCDFIIPGHGSLFKVKK